MAGDFHLCIGDRTSSLPPKSDKGENDILHIQFHSTEKNHYELKYEDVEKTLLTEFLKERFGSEFHEPRTWKTFVEMFLTEEFTGINGCSYFSVTRKLN